MMKYLSQRSKENFAGQVCILRVDFNLKSLADIFRVQAILPTIKFLTSRKAKVLLLSHRGRPDISSEKDKKDLSLKKICLVCSRLLKKKITFISDFDFSDIKYKLKNAANGSVFMLENLRFISGEKENSLEFGEKLANLGDFYVNEAFAASHRASASVAAITQYIDSYQGILFESEIRNLSACMINPKRPMVVIIGGSKIDDKIEVVENLYANTDYFLFGSTAFNSSSSKVRNLIDGVKIIGPQDGIVKESWWYDIGPKTIEEYIKIINKAKTIIWNGPVGLNEKKQYANGSIKIAKAIANSHAFSVVGGGETTNLILKLKLQKKIKFLSTGGGAMLDFLASKCLPGIEALEK